MMDALANNDITAEYSTSFPADLSLYSSIFLAWEFILITMY